MRGYIPFPSYRLGVTTFILTTDVDKLMQPDAILINDDSPDDAILEARDILKQTYPDIEEGYGQVYCSGNVDFIEVYDNPGFNINSTSSEFSVELLANICKKYGTVRYFPDECGLVPYENAANEAGLVRSAATEDVIPGWIPRQYFTYRYDEKAQKRRLKKKGAPAKRNHTFLAGTIARLVQGAKGNGSLVSANIGDLKFPKNFSIQEQALMRLEFFLLTNTKETVPNFDSVKEEWEKSVLDPKTTNEASIKTIKLLDKLFRDN